MNIGHSMNIGPPLKCLGVSETTCLIPMLGGERTRVSTRCRNLYLQPLSEEAAVVQRFSFWISADLLPLFSLKKE